ncbi:MAG TPA: DUF5808 domain-containing protein [Candidatus Acidoferrales bacterium]|nr:DUF5808 domain-containing protein [Candidatus Acidoferrales bacterium]
MMILPPPGPIAAATPSPGLLLGLGIALLLALALLDYVLRLKISAAPDDRTDERYWKAGMFYANPKDPALFVSKPSGLGYTVNFARPAGWAVLVALLLGPLAAIWLAAHR